MSDREYILSFIKKIRSKMNTAIMIRQILNGLIGGALVAAIVEGISCIWSFYYAHLAAGL